MPNPLSKFGLTDQEIDAEMARNPEVLKGLQDLAHRVEESLKEKAPVFGATGRDERREAAPDPEHPFRDSIHTELIRTKEGLPGALVGSSHYLAVPIEIGDLHMPELAIFTKTGREFGDTTGPVFSNEGVQQAQGNLRGELQKLSDMKAGGASAASIKAQESAVKRARTQRSAAFNAARRRGRGR